MDYTSKLTRFLRAIVLAIVFTVLTLGVLGTEKAHATTVNVTDSNLQWSPYGWVASGSTYKQSPTTGSYIDVAFTGTTLGLNVDNSFFAPATPSGLQISAFIDGSTTPVTRTMADVSTGQIMITTGLASGNHYAHIVITTNTNYATRWASVSGTPRSTLRINSIQLQTGANILPVNDTPIAKVGPRVLFYGDSITEGNGISSSGAQSWAAITGNELNARFGIHGYAGQTWWISLNSQTADFYYPEGEADYPNGVWNNYYQGTSFLNTATDPASGYKEDGPDAVFNNLGINDAAGYAWALTNAPSQAPALLAGLSQRITSWLEDTRSATDPYAPVFIVMPFGYSCTTANNPSVTPTVETAYETMSAMYNTVVSDYKVAHNDPRVYIIDLGVDGCLTVVNNSSDNLHPNPTGSAILGQMITTATEPYLYTTLSVKSSDQTVDSGFTFTSSKPTLTGTGIPGSTIQATLGPESCTTTVGVDSQWSCTFANVISNGSYSLSITETTPWDEVFTNGPFSVTVAVTDPNLPTLAETGVDLRFGVGIAAILATSGIAMFIWLSAHRTKRV